MLKHLVIAGVLLALAGVPVNAQTSLPCIKFPFQAAAQGDVPPIVSGTSHASVSIALPSSLVEIEQVTLRLKTLTNNGHNLSGARLTTTLYTQTVTHGTDITSNGSGSSFYATPGRDAATSKSVTFYADAASSLHFDFDTGGGEGDTARIFVTIVGRLVTPGCWIGPQ